MIEWIIALSVTVIIAVIGWTLAVSQAARKSLLEKIEKEMIRLESVVRGDSTRISVLENQHNTVMAALARIEGLLTEHLRVR